MSGVGEIIGIVACVAAIVSAYKDGSSIVHRVKEKRRRSRAQQPPEYLEESLQFGATAIQATHTTGVRRFGTVFGEGDGEPRRGMMLAHPLLTPCAMQIALSTLSEMSR
jgi:hypothetical protein